MTLKSVEPLIDPELVNQLNGIEDELEEEDELGEDEVPSKNQINRIHQKNIERITKLPEGVAGLVASSIMSMRLEMLIDATAGSMEEDNRKQFEWIFEQRLEGMLGNLEDQVKKLQRQAMMTAPGERRTEQGLIVPP